MKKSIPITPNRKVLNEFRELQIVFTFFVLVLITFPSNVYGQLQQPQIDSISVTQNGFPILSWFPNTDNTVGYVILNAIQHDQFFFWHNIDTVYGIENSSYVHQIDACDAQKFYRLYAINPYGIPFNSLWSDTLVTIHLNQLQYDPVSNLITLEWTEYKNMISELYGYQVLASMDGISYNLIGSTDPAVTSFVHTALLPNVQYSYKIRAINEDGTRASTSCVYTIKTTVSTIENLNVSMRTDGTGLVDIHFDLNGTGASYNLQIEASFDDGANYEPLSVNYLTGELIEVLPGTAKHIIWAGKDSHPETFSTQTRVRVIAISPFECGNLLLDNRDGQSYATVLIGEQCWMAENLNVGSIINSSQRQTNNAIQEKYCYDNDPENCNIFGGLYEWEEMMQYVPEEPNQGICPDGWRVPKNEDFCIMLTLLDPTVQCNLNNVWSGIDAGGKIKSTGTLQNGDGLWNEPNTGATNESGFTGLPSGLFGIWPESGFKYKNENFVFWTSTRNLSYAGRSWMWTTNYFRSDIVRDDFPWYNAFSVRCLKSNFTYPNQPPEQPFDPSPETGSANHPVSTTLTWSCSDPEGDPLTYDVYFGTDANPPLTVLSITAQTYTLAMLEYSTTYYWKIVAHDDQGNSTEGELWSFTTEDEWECGDSFVDDRDGNVYSTVQIGNQCWMAENLMYLPFVFPKYFTDNTAHLYYVYDYDGNDAAVAKTTANYQNYGALYNWPASLDACPHGWHLPNDQEWEIISVYLGGENIAGGKMKSTRTEPEPHPRWDNPNIGASNESGFSAFPGGSLAHFGVFYALGGGGGWWTATEASPTGSFDRGIGASDSSIGRHERTKADGFSVRCVWDEEVMSNQPPVSPSNPSPETGAINQTITPTLSWTCSDPENDPLTYDVYFGTDENPSLAVSGISDQTYTPATLEHSTTYYWKIVAHDDQENSTEGEMWSFTTIAPLAPLPDYVPLDGLVGWWPFVGNANDVSGNENHGIVTSAELTSDRYGLQNAAYLFEQSANSLIEFNIGDRIFNEFSMMFWVKPNRDVAVVGESNSCNGIIDVPMAYSQNWVTPAPHGLQSQLGVGISIGTNGVFTAEGATNIITGRLCKSQTITEFVNLTLVYRLDSAFLYLDGEKIRARSMYCTANSKFIDSTFIVGSTVLYSPSFDGIIDDVGLWNRALTHSEVIALYQGNQSFSCGDSFVDDRDGNVYSTVQIGGQCWMAENLNIGLLVNAPGNMLNNDTIEKHCYDNDIVNCHTYGGLYQWDEMMKYSTEEPNKGICPIGWHIPTNDDFCALVTLYDPSINCDQNGGLQGTDIGGILKSTGTLQGGDGLWESPNTGATNESGFSAIPSGVYCETFQNSFDWIGKEEVFWTSAHQAAGNNWSWRWSVNYSYASIVRDNFPRDNSYSVRCIKDN
jgi:uncharacterized protein (TIGR02145 family)